MRWGGWAANLAKSPAQIWTKIDLSGALFGRGKVCGKSIMRIVNIDKISAGMRLGEAVRGARGQVLLTRGTILTAAYVATLQTLGVPAVYIADPDTADVEIPQPISAESRTRVLKNISRTFDELAEATEEMRKSSV